MQEQLPRAQGCECLILLSVFGIAIHGFWIPAIPAGMTCFKILVSSNKRSA